MRSAALPWRLAEGGGIALFRLTGKTREKEEGGGSGASHGVVEAGSDSSEEEEKRGLEIEGRATCEVAVVRYVNLLEPLNGFLSRLLIRTEVAAAWGKTVDILPSRDAGLFSILWKR